MSHLLRIPLLALLLTATLALQAQGLQAQEIDFPELTGRVVDRAELLDPATETRLSERLAAHEEATTEQLVVATLPDLQGVTIEEYGYQLGRHWGIGQEEKDNGALLIVAPNERKVRIEVGYGLEGRLTDAQSSAIINQTLTPAFREGDYARGISEGVAAMIRVLGGEPMDTRATSGTTSGTPADEQGPQGPASILFFVMFVIVMSLVRGGRGGLLAGLLLGGALGGGSRGGGGFGDGGGFGGGGGGFGGGGASGGW
ncbi:TPM domain-containing protein [Halomonas sp. KAO]|uniref:TPM domain-containing protein n=1 Tax=Halomonas sp. KAO TaxID=2783858 RepID=UPI00189F3121|nr:TPM domain-containing protein [Halomonas sp. KAO]MBF7054961.1 TPM domain-containing protein [Halomonas sp. KAO]